jgi:hypothetical protein
MTDPSSFPSRCSTLCPGGAWYQHPQYPPPGWVCGRCHPPAGALADQALPLGTRRTTLMTAARAGGFPALPLARHIAVAPGEAAWATFVMAASSTDIERATDLLRTHTMEGTHATAQPHHHPPPGGARR